METKDKIIDEATRQFLQFGVRNVTMDGIASALGMSKRTVYETFKDKNELVNTCLKILNQKYKKRNEKLCCGSSNVIETIFLFMQEGIKSMNAINPVFFRDMEKLYPDTWNAIRENKEKEALRLSKELLQKGIKEGLFREEIHIPIIAKLFQEQIKLLADENVFPHDEYSFADVFQSLMINFMRGISTRKGIELIDSMLAK